MNKGGFYKQYGVYPLRRWTFPKTRPYNGFTPDERIRGWQLTMWFLDNGWRKKPERCSITGDNANVVNHNENYYEPWAPYAISRGAHMALHQRFKKLDWWKRIVAENTVTGNEWFCSLSLDPYDMAASIRADVGHTARDVFDRAPVPEGLEVPWDLIRPSIHPLGDIY